MLNGTILRKSLLCSVVALAVTAPGAYAAADADAPEVCNQATPVSLGGPLTTAGDDPLPPARYRDELLWAHRGKGRGLVNAAGNSPALAVCGFADAGEDPGDGGGGGGGGGPIDPMPT